MKRCMIILNKSKPFQKNKKDPDEEAVKQRINYLLIRLLDKADQFISDLDRQRNQMPLFRIAGSMSVWSYLELKIR